MLDFDVLHVPCGHNNAHGFYIEEEGKSSLPVCGRHRTYRKYYSSANKLTITFYAPKEVTNTHTPSKYILNSTTYPCKKLMH